MYDDVQETNKSNKSEIVNLRLSFITVDVQNDDMKVIFRFEMPSFDLVENDAHLICLDLVSFPAGSELDCIIHHP